MVPEFPYFHGSTPQFRYRSDARNSYRPDVTQAVFFFFFFVLAFLPLYFYWIPFKVHFHFISHKNPFEAIVRSLIFFHREFTPPRFIL
jgi:hypothetical protein